MRKFWSRRAVTVLGLLMLGAIGVGETPARGEDAGAAQAQQALMGDLVLLRGRLLAGRELYQFVQDRDAAKRHHGAALNSRMAAIEKNARPDDAKAIQAAVTALAALAEKGGGFAAYEAAYNAAMAATQRAERAVTDGRLSQPAFVAAVFHDVISHAAEDYAAAVKDGKVAVIKEYEEIFGYNLAAVRFVRLLQQKPEGKPLATPKMLEDVAMIERAVPSPVPPVKLVMSPDAFNAIAGRLKQIAAK